MNRDFQSIVGKEVKRQIIKEEGKLPDYIIACVGGGSNAIGIFYKFLKNKNVKLIAVEAGGKGINDGEHSMSFKGSVGVVEGYKSYFLQNDDGQIQQTYSIAAGMDYPGIGPELSYLKDKGRIEADAVSDDEVINAFKLICKTEGIIPALESAHAIAKAIILAPELKKNKIIVVNISGRGDKDIFILADKLKDKNFFLFLKDYLANERF
jgi:tryptophan synthase beta chain